VGSQDCLSGTFATSAGLFKKFAHLNLEPLGQVPEGDDGRIALTFFEPADVSPINAHSLGKLGLGHFRPKPQSPHIAANQFSRVLSH